MMLSSDHATGDRGTDELRTALAIHAIALSEMAQGLCVFDSDFRIVLFNRRLSEVLACPRSAVKLGVTMRDVFTQRWGNSQQTDGVSVRMWAELSDRLLCREPFTLHQRFRPGPVIAFQFRPTVGGGWVMTCDEPPAPDPSREASLAHFLKDVDSYGVCAFDSGGQVIAYNDHFLHTYGWERKPVKLGSAFVSVLKHALRTGTFAKMVAKEIGGALSACQTGSKTVKRFELHSGRFVELRIIGLKSGGWLTEHEDVTFQVRHEQTLEQRNRILDGVLSNMAHGLCAYDEGLRLIVANQCYLEIYGLTPSDALPGTPMLELIRCSISRGIHCPGITAEQMLRDLRRRLVDNNEPLLYRHLADGRVIAVRHRPLVGGGWVGTYEDITERQRAAEHIQHIARHDSLTDLPNRFMFGERMSEGLGCVRKRDVAMAVMSLDLDNFKEINDSLGHPVGDRLLAGVAKRLGNVIGAHDTLARLGGDEFAVLHPETTSEDTRQLAQRLIEAVASPFTIAGHEIYANISVGVAVAPKNGKTSDRLMKCADLALYRAKAQGGNIVRFFTPDMEVQLQARRILETELRRSLVNGDFGLVYQPLMNVRSKEIIGMEVLLRWAHPTQGLVPPSEFIPIAEQTGIIVPLGEWVLRQACMEAAGWPASVRLAVNISPVQFRNPALVTSVTDALAAARLPPERLELEITEAAIIKDEDAAVAMLDQLRSLGARIAMDDFGTGYSSLSYLRRFPFDKIKIDRSFVTDIGLRADSPAIIQAIATLGMSLGLETTAEGIETEDQFTLVQLAGCTEVQGYLIGRPCSANDARKFIQQFRWSNIAA